MLRTGNREWGRDALSVMHPKWAQVTALFFKADRDYGRRVAAGLGLDVKEVERLAAMSQEERVKATSA